MVIASEMLEESKREDSRESELSGIRVRPFATGPPAIPLSRLARVAEEVDSAVDVT
jgi:hypothetical protein